MLHGNSLALRCIYEAENSWGLVSYFLLKKCGAGWKMCFVWYSTYVKTCEPFLFMWSFSENTCVSWYSYEMNVASMLPPYATLFCLELPFTALVFLAMSYSVLFCHCHVFVLVLSRFILTHFVLSSTQSLVLYSIVSYLFISALSCFALSWLVLFYVALACPTLPCLV